MDFAERKGAHLVDVQIYAAQINAVYFGDLDTARFGDALVVGVGKGNLRAFVRIGVARGRCWGGG